MGPRGFEVKLLVNTRRLPGGVERNKDWVVGPAEVATMSHQRWWFDGVSADAGYYPSPASVFEGVWGPVQNYQK